VKRTHIFEPNLTHLHGLETFMGSACDPVKVTVYRLDMLASQADNTSSRRTSIYRAYFH
jgi:hypothetical protein